MKKMFLLGMVSWLFFSCQKENKIAHVERAFYYWKSDNYQMSQHEDSVCKKVKVNKLYVKFFEVDYSDALGFYPISKTELYFYNGQDSLTLVPTVYIKNSALMKASKTSIDTLADNVNFLIDKYCNEKFKRVKKPTEFQMDCDWTLKTKDNYFYFLKKLKEISKKEISCTLRLYPYKYPDKMGVPPVDKVSLMCYNLMNPLENAKKNSILDVDELESYLKTSSKYPKHIDVALPIYSWMQVYHNERFSNVLYANNEQIKKVLKEDKPLWFTVIKDTTVAGNYLRIGDKIKFEEINAAKITKTIELLKHHIDFDEHTTVSLFHLDDEQLNNFTNEEVSRFFTDFSK